MGSTPSLSLEPSLSDRPTRGTTSDEPSVSPSSSPSTSPSNSPSAGPSKSPSASPSESPSNSPSASPSESPSASPSASPSESPSAKPSTSPSESPSAQPSPSPSTPFPTVDPICNGRPWVITFLYNGGDCSQSYNLQPRQKFDCTDAGSTGPPTNAGDESYITAVPRGDSINAIVFFAGTVPVGEKYTLNADRVYDKLAPEMTLTIYDEEGG